VAVLTLRTTLLGALAACLGAVPVIAVAAWGYGVAWSARDGTAVLVLLLIALGVHSYAARSDDTLRRAGICIAAAAFVLTAANTLLRMWPVHEYGDNAFLVGVVESGKPFSRWLAGSAILTWVYAGVWKFPPVSALLPGAATAHAFVGLAGSLCMSAAAVTAFIGRRRTLAVYLSVTSTIWLVFSLGYVEYYPFIAGGLILFLSWLHGTPWERHDPRTLGMALGVVASAYVGFWPVAAIFGLVFAWSAPRRNWSVIAWLVVTYLCLVRLFWPQSPSDFFASLWNDMNFGERSISARYAGQSAGPTSVYFATAYVMTAWHLKELAYQAFFSGTIAPLLLLGVALGGAARGVLGRFARGGASASTIGAALVLGYYARYFIWKIPKLGPRTDIDLYFVFYLLVTFYLGLALERGAAGGSLGPERRYMLLSFLSGAAVPLCYVFVVAGLPPI
jgi:hypothetical protein